MNPSFLLVPTPPQRRESWKGVALTMMVLLGLSTSALALTLYSSTDPSSHQPVPLRLELDASAIHSQGDEVKDVVLATEPPLYEISRIPGTTVRPTLPRKLVGPRASVRAVESSVQSSSSRSFKNVSTCDEVSCLIDGSNECCEIYQNAAPASSELEEALSRPYRPTRNQIMTPMQSIEGRVEACADSFGYSGVAKVMIVIAPQGSIASFELDDGGAAFQSCVERHVRTLEFPTLSQSFRFSYPFRF